MDTDLFFNEYYKTIRREDAATPTSSIANGFDKFFIGSVVVFMILYGVTLFFSMIKESIVLALSALFIVFYLTRKMSTGEAQIKTINNQKIFQQRRFQAIKNLLEKYRINNGDSIDELIECLNTNKEKYKFGQVFGPAIKTGLGIVSFVLSSVFTTALVKKITEKAETKILPDFAVEALADWLLESWPWLLLDIGMTVVLIVELCFVWFAIIKPFIWKKYYYHETMIIDLKAYKLFNKYHEEMAIGLTIPQKEDGKLKKLVSRIGQFFTKERHFNFKKKDADKRNIGVAN